MKRARSPSPNPPFPPLTSSANLDEAVDPSASSIEDRDEGGDTSQVTFGGAADELILRILHMIPEVSWTDLVNVGLVNKQLAALCKTNNLWLTQFHKVLSNGHGAGLDMSCFYYGFVNWLDAMIVHAEVHPLLRSYAVGVNLDEREYIIFKEGTLSEVMLDYKLCTPHVCTARLRMGPVMSEAGYAASRDANMICAALADILERSFHSLVETVIKSQQVSHADENNGYTMRPLLQHFDGTILWYQLFKLCAIDWQYSQCAKSSWGSLRALYTDIDRAQTMEIAAMISNGSYAPGARDDVPTIWQRPMEYMVRQYEGYPRCYTCNKFYSVGTNTHVEKAMSIINRFRGVNIPGFCSTSCLLKGLTEISGITVSCANPNCGSETDLRNAYHLTLAELNTRPSRTVVITGMAVKKDVGVNLDVLVKERQHELIEAVFLIRYMGVALKDELAKLVYMNAGLDTPSVPGATDVRTAVDSDTPKAAPKYYISMLPDDALATKAQSAGNLSTKVWESRLETYRLIRGKLQGAYLPWAFIGAGLPAVRTFFAMPYVVCDELLTSATTVTPSMASRKRPGQPALSFCGAACMYNHLCTHSPSAPSFPSPSPSSAASATMACTTTIPPLEVVNTSAKDEEGSHDAVVFAISPTFIPMKTQCLNPACARRFNIAHASLTLECFELLYQSKKDRESGEKPPVTRGYVCDYFCRDVYIAKRREKLIAMRKNTIDVSSNMAATSSSSSSPLSKRARFDTSSSGAH